MPVSRAVFRSLVFGGVILTAWLFAAVARAQPDLDVSQFQAVARVKAEEGLGLYADGRWAEAYERFRVAEELFHAPTLVLYMGHCKRELREWRAARALYRRVAEEEIAADADDAYHRAKETAAAAVVELDGLIPRLSLEVVGSAEARVTLDGAPVVVPLAEQELDPGPHEIEAVAPGSRPARRRVVLEPGARESVVLELEPLPKPKPPPPRPAPEPGSLVPGFVAFGVSAAGFLMGAIAGGVAIAQVNAIEEDCDGEVCPEGLRDEADQAQTLSTVSNVGFIVGGVGAIVGTILVIVRPGGGSVDEALLRLGPGSASLTLSF